MLTNALCKRLLLLSVFSLPLAAVADGINTFSGATFFTFSGNRPGAVWGPSSGYLTVCPNDLPENDPSCKEGSIQFITPQTVISGTVEAPSGGGQIVRGSIASDAYGGDAPVQYVSFVFESRNFFSVNPAGHIAIGARAFIPFTGSGLDPYTPAYGTVLPHAYGDGIILGSVCNGVSRGVAVEHFWAPFGANPSNEVGACKNAIFQDYQTYIVKVAVENAGTNTRRIKYQITQVSFLGGTVVAQDLQGTEFPDTPPAGWGWWRLTQPAHKASWFVANIFTAPSTPWSFRIANFTANTANQLPAGFFY
ncbi:hypothetical protein [Hyalangium versicolor]|uniref:hypothetical protein n=1 Tax=Hyalangium versicolor TaxID=2861190 RepID=UPI001CCF73CB|nr:hypothetical protein [Hyalangium versicolor]